MSDLFSLCEQARERAAEPWVLVTLVKTDGSTYRKVGAHMLVSPQGHLGMISGGCLEADVAQRCQPLFDEGAVSALEFTIDTRLMLGCDGRLTLVAERLPKSLIDQVREARNDRKPRVLSVFAPGPLWRGASLAESGAEGAFTQPIVPALRLMVFGSTRGALPLVSMAAVLGWGCEHLVMASDPRGRHGGGQASVADLLALSESRVDSRTACVVMNHHVGRDLEVLVALWNTPTPFLGLLGGHKRRDQIMERLAFDADLGVDLDSRHLHAPVGLRLGAEGAAEIALEICSEIQSVFSGVGSATRDVAPFQRPMINIAR